MIILVVILLVLVTSSIKRMNSDINIQNQEKEIDDYLDEQRRKRL